MKTLLKVDEASGCAYLYLKDPGTGESFFQKEVSTPQGDLVLDFDSDGRLVGIEFLSLGLLP